MIISGKDRNGDQPYKRQSKYIEGNGWDTFLDCYLIHNLAHLFTGHPKGRENMNLNKHGTKNRERELKCKRMSFEMSSRGAYKVRYQEEEVLLLIIIIS